MDLQELLADRVSELPFVILIWLSLRHEVKNLAGEIRAVREHVHDLRTNKCLKGLLDDEKNLMPWRNLIRDKEQEKGTENN